MRLPKYRRPVHPGKAFLDSVLEPLGISRKEAAERLGIPYTRLNQVINGKRGVTAETALRFARFTKTEPESWLNLQRAVDMWDVLHSEDLEEIDAIEPVGDSASGGDWRPD